MPTLLTSRIDAVTVHRRGAIVARVAELPDTLEGALQIGPLPLDIDEGSVRVSIEAPGDLRATDLRVALLAPEPDEALAPARPEDLEAAGQEVARLRDAVEAIDRTRRRLRGVGTVVRPAGEPGAEPPPSPAEARIALLTLRDTSLRDADAKRRALAGELRAAERALADLRERERLRTSMRRTEPDELRKVVEVRLAGERGAGEAALRVEYRVDAARWAPTYALRLDRAMGGASLELRAMVAQRTGEDWDGVALSLSTASLQAWSELPELASVRIGRRQPKPPKSGWRPPPTGADLLFADHDRAREPVVDTTVTRAPEPSPIVAMDALEESPKLERFAMAQANAPHAPPPPTQAAPAPRGMPAAAPSAPMAFGAADELSDVLLEAEAAIMPQAKRSRGAGGAIAGALGALASSLARDEGGAATLGLEELDEASIDAAMLDYGRLRLPASKASNRGKLVLWSRRQLYVEQIEQLHLEVDLGAALAAVDAARSEVLSAPLPPGCAAPRESGFDYVYRASGRLDAPSDGVFHNLGLAARDGEARARFVVVPRESRDAFRFVELDNPLDAPLLDGPVDIFIGGDFLMTSAIEEVPEGGVVRLGLGVEQRLKVSRNARFSEKSSGLMGGKLDLLHTIEVELDNLLPRAAEVEVRERIPVLREQEDDIRVEEGSASPAWEEWEPDEQPELEGGRRWQVTVAPGEKRTLTASYAVRIASKHELVGGNRREA
ncbi:MAG: DUF4139 domain-containing protein [Sandaracinaceae bacterium]|nr:DUF4139 domain-containing protein [Sandaracinaceae bacterium]